MKVARRPIAPLWPPKKLFAHMCRNCGAALWKRGEKNWATWTGVACCPRMKASPKFKLRSTGPPAPRRVMRRANPDLR